ncbi:MAG TPA: hypothetical protein VGM54_21155 [Chthoniobacter sp.]|jgi:hypothetical protein
METPPPDGHKWPRLQTIAIYLSVVVTAITPFIGLLGPQTKHFLLLLPNNSPATNYFLYGDDGTSIHPNAQGAVEVPSRWKTFRIFCSSPLRMVEMHDAKSLRDGSAIIIEMNIPVPTT